MKIERKRRWAITIIVAGVLYGSTGIDCYRQLRAHEVERIFVVPVLPFIAFANYHDGFFNQGFLFVSYGVNMKPLCCIYGAVE